MKITAVHALKSKRGITLIELLIVAAIVAILAGIAIPMYNGYMQRARRADAKTALEQLRASQEMRRAERGSYSVVLNLSELQTTWGGPPTMRGLHHHHGGDINDFYGHGYTYSRGRQVADGALTINQDGVEIPADKWRK